MKTSKNARRLFSTRDKHALSDVGRLMEPVARRLLGEPNSKLSKPQSQQLPSSAPICAPARVLEVELLDRDWRVTTSSDGVQIEIAQPRARALAARNSGTELSCARPTNNNPGLQGDSKTKRLARALLRDRAPSSKPPAPTCFTCGRSYWRGDGRFCSARCREAFDAGFPPYDPSYAEKTNPRWYSLPIGDTAS